ncbi:tyrosine-type recombinase/integrase [Pseudobutyrivibrio ruminis]|uniref:tyrosine-type recombinase/integrase n=1 Tax=Pseudobutyrivibrio ruminis TaxID=46206 RepID=UPI00051BF4EF|nr:tyrosine-type recombinase/integrase [Pseudobutyrivibrio ruminis]
MNKIFKFSNELRRMINNQKDYQLNLENEYKCGIISVADMQKEIEMSKTKELALKRKLVAQVHIKANGTPKSIRYEASRDLWVTKISGDIRLHARTEELLIDKILDYYDCYVVANTLEHIFELAIETKEKTDNCSPLTIKRLRQEYNHFISDEFGKRDIKSISKDDLKAYTNEMLERLNPTPKAFLKYKGVLNLIWRYAVEYGYVQVDIVKGISNQQFRSKCDNSKPKSKEKILSRDDILRIQNEIYRRMQFARYNGYFIYGFMILLAIETGMRAAELCSLKWADILDNRMIHIHSQQLSNRETGNRIVYYVPWTKDEKGISQGGRYYPITDKIAKILLNLKTLQEEKHIASEYVFCDVNGDWITVGAYQTCLRRLMRSMGFSITRNHAFRMSLNSNEFIPKGIPVTDRARLLGHSVETNLRHYSYARINVDDEIRTLLNG